MHRVNHVTWPAVNPVWDFCWSRPSSSSLPQGEGIEITNVKYQGILIIKRAHIPVINVKYIEESGSCGCFRDWLDSEIRFECSPSPSNGYCTGTTLPAQTVCQHPGSDLGSFTGVAVEDKGTHLLLTSQTSAGWYRYIPVWEFYADGTLQARMDAAAVNNNCVAHSHRHHVYWRFDFAVDGDGNDFVDYAPSQNDSYTRVTQERTFIDTGDDRSQWQVGSAGSSALVQIVRNDKDEAAGDPGTPIQNDFPVADGWLLTYADNQVTDQGGGCAINLASYVNSQSVNGADVVLWVRASSLHIGEPGGVSESCFMFGPTIHVLSPGPIPTATPDPNAPTKTPTATGTITRTGTRTATPTLTRTPTATRSFTVTRTSTRTRTPSPIPSAPAPSETPSPLPTEAPPENTLTPTPKVPPTETNTPVSPDDPTETPTMSNNGPLLVAPLMDGQHQVQVIRALPAGSTIDVLSLVRADTLGSGVSDQTGLANIQLSRDLEAGEQVMAMNRSSNSVGPQFTVQAPAGWTPSSTPTATSPAPALLGRPGPESTGIVFLVALLAAAALSLRRMRRAT